MNRWLREGKDVNAMLPYLMRYMGHSDVKNTLYYLHLVPDIYGDIGQIQVLGKTDTGGGR